MGRTTRALACVAAALLAAVLGCSTSSAGAGDGSAEAATVVADARSEAGEDASGAACIAAGGFCASGDVSCTNVGPQDCGFSGGGFCCLPPKSGECREAGGQCLVGNVSCAVPGPQSCGPNSAGLYCCLSNVGDASEAQSDATIDASGPALCVGLGGQCYFGTFTCDYSPDVPVDCGPDSLCCLQDVTYPDGSGAPADECIEAGGQCKVGNFPCAVWGHQSCGPQGPGGIRCCLSEPDAGAN